ncbi:MAG: hypothetical protein VW644_12995 [Alphaproteobacteria bacterium]|jgi:hypothetical protein
MSQSSLSDMSLRKPVIVGGVTLPRRRFTGWAAVYFVVFALVPVTIVGVALDAAFYFLFAEAFDSCFALLCLFANAAP